MKKDSVNTLKGTFILLGTAFIWGIAFAFQKSAMDHIGPFIFVAVRMLLGGLTLLIVIKVASLFSTLKNKRKYLEDFKSYFTSQTFVGGIILGGIIAIGSSMQQVGLTMTSASKSGFLTAPYIILVPIFGLIFFKTKTHWNTWISVVIALFGLYFLSIKNISNLTIEPGDLVLLLSTILWAFHVLTTNYFANRVNAKQVISLSMVQFFVASILCFIASIFADAMFSKTLNFELFLAALPSLLYVGVMSTGIAFTTQGLGQRFVKPTIASLIMSTEAVFGVLGGIVLLHERMTLREILGCSLLFIAIVLAQLNFTKKK